MSRIDEYIEFNPYETLKIGQKYKYIPMEKLNTFKRKPNGYDVKKFKQGTKFTNGDTILAKITPCFENGKTAYVDIFDKNEVGFGSTEYIVMRKKQNKTDDKYIYYLSRYSKFREYAINSMTGTSGRKRIQLDKLKEYNHEFPDLLEQEKISSFLSKLDDKIELNNNIISTLVDISKMVYNYWFIQYDFPNDEGKPYKSSGGKMIWNDELKVNIPYGWEVKQLGDFVSKRTQKQINYKNLSMIDLSVMKSDDLVIDNIISTYKTKTVPFKIEECDILFGSIRPYLHKAGISTINGVTPGTVYAYTPNDDKIYTFLLSTMTHNNIFEYSMCRSKGTRMPVISSDDLLKYKIPYNNTIAAKYSKIIDIKNIIVEKVQHNRELESLRDFLLPLLISGKLLIE